MNVDFFNNGLLVGFVLYESFNVIAMAHSKDENGKPLFNASVCMSAQQHNGLITTQTPRYLLCPYLI